MAPWPGNRRRPASLPFARGSVRVARLQGMAPVMVARQWSYRPPRLMAFAAAQPSAMTLGEPSALAMPSVSTSTRRSGRPQQGPRVSSWQHRGWPRGRPASARHGQKKTLKCTYPERLHAAWTEETQSELAAMVRVRWRWKLAQLTGAVHGCPSRRQSPPKQAESPGTRPRPTCRRRGSPGAVL